MLKYKEPTKEQCIKYRNNPEINPITGRKIISNGTVAKRLNKQCNICTKVREKIVKLEECIRNIKYKNQLSPQLSKRQCLNFIRKPTIDPRNNEKIDPTGIRAMEIIDICKNMKYSSDSIKKHFLYNSQMKSPTPYSPIQAPISFSYN